MTDHDDGLPNDPEGIRLMIHALVDGELDAAAALAVERRIAADPQLAAEHARIVALQGAVSRLPRPDVSDAFRARIAAIGMALGKPTQDAGAAAGRTVGAAGIDVRYRRRPEAKRRYAACRRREHGARARRFGSFDWRAMAASIMISAVLASGATQWVMVNSASDGFAAAVASGHRRSLLAASPIDIVSSDRHTVKPWLDARIGVSPPAPDLAAGRLRTDRRPGRGDRRPSGAGAGLPPPRAPDHAGRRTDSRAAALSPSRRTFRQAASRMVHWSDGAFSYWAISDMERPELDDFVARFRKAAV